VKYPVLILSASVALLAAAPPPPPPPPSALPAATASPGTAAATPPPAPVTSADPNADLNSMFGSGASPKPGASAAPGPRATPSPPPDARKGIEGVWELQIQRGANTEYEHMNRKQDGTTLTGIYLTQNKKKYPLAGSLDGTNVHMVISLSDGSTIVLEGRVDGTTDMLGMFTDAKESVPFTAAYRPKEKWIDNLNAQPGGMGSPSNGPPQ
jgi:hypothetical protein